MIRSAFGRVRSGLPAGALLTLLGALLLPAVSPAQEGGRRGEPPAERDAENDEANGTEERNEEENALGEVRGVGSENFLIQFGLVTLNPFEIQRIDGGEEGRDDDTLRLDTSDVSARFMLEVGANLRWAWGRGDELCLWRPKSLFERRAPADADEEDLRPPRKAPCPKLVGERRDSNDWFFMRLPITWQRNDEGGIDFGGQWPLRPVLPGSRHWIVPDFQARLGYTFGTDAKDASSAVGSGDLHGEVFLGWSLFRSMTEDGFAFSLGPEVGLSLVTDRDAQDIHDNWLAGAAIAASMEVEGGRRAQLIYRVGYSRYEVPTPVGDTDEVVNENGYPDFEEEEGAANYFEFHYPLGETAYASAVGRFYNGSDPNPWSFNVGVSVEIGPLVEGLGGLLGAIGGGSGD